MKLQKIALIALCALCCERASAAITITNSSTTTSSGGAWSGLQFSFADTASSRLTTSGGLGSLPADVVLNSISFTNISTGTSTNWSTTLDRILVLLDSSNKIVAWSNTVSLLAANAASSPTFDFAAAPQLSASQTYKFAFSDSVRINNIAGGLVAGNTFNFSTSGTNGGTVTEIRAQGTGSLINYGNTTNSASLAGISQTGATQSNNIIYAVSFDVSPIPEPSSLGLLGVGMAGMLLRRRRKQA